MTEGKKFYKVVTRNHPRSQFSSLSFFQVWIKWVKDVEIDIDTICSIADAYTIAILQLTNNNKY